IISRRIHIYICLIFFFQAEDGIRDRNVTGVQTCALPICKRLALPNARILMHQPAVGESGHGQASDIEIQAAEILRMRTWLEETRSEERRVGTEWRSQRAAARATSEGEY